MKIDEVTADTRFSFTAGFVVGAIGMARRAAQIEAIPVDQVDDDVRMDHRSCVVSAVMQAAAAIESEVAEVAVHGPGHHLGTNGVDADARAFLQPLAEVIDDQNPALERYALVLHLLRKPAFDRGAQPWQGAALLMRLRNEVVHYKSRWGAEMSREKLWRSLLDLGHPKPPFRQDGENFFPHRCLSATCATWAARTSVGFIDAFYDHLGVASPLNGHRERLRV
jgi:hypothetical protein